MRKAARSLLLLLSLGVPLPALSAGPDAPTAPALSADEQARDVFVLLVGEIAAQTGQPQLASHELLLAAQALRSPELFERATEIAVAAGFGDQALEAVAGWRRLQPDAIKPLAWQAKLQLELGRSGGAAAAIAKLLELTPAPQRGPAVLALLPTFEQINDAQQALQLARRALVGCADLPESWLVLGELETRAGDGAGAFAHARRALAADPGSAQAAALLLQNYKADPQQADALMQPYFAAPRRADAELRLAWIGAAMDQQRGGIALREALALTQARPDLAEGWLFLGSVQLELGQAAGALQSLQSYLDRTGDKPQRARQMAAFELSQAALDLGDFDQAQRWLQQVGTGYDDLAVALQRALIQLGQGHAHQAQATLAALPGATPAQRQQRLLAQARLQRQMGHQARAWSLLQRGLGDFGHDGAYLYEAALAAQRAGHADAMDDLLRQALAVDPRDATALNALGYALADRNRDLDQADTLLRQALALSPGNPFVIDSVAWLRFRQGRLQQAQALLQQALAAQPDAEIQAHLAEVLWARGEHGRATELLRQAWQQAPQADGVRAALARLGLQF